MSSTIQNGKNQPINFQTGTVPDVSGAMNDYFQPMTFTVIEKQTVDFQLIEVPTAVTFRGVLQPFTERQLLLKPEGERAWTWFWLHAQPSLTLQVDDVVVWNGKQTRIASRKDYRLYGYVEYHLLQDWTGSGP